MASDGTPPNVLIVLVDAARADQTSPYPGGPNVTPNLARLAEEATVFERAVTPAPWTLPSVTSLLTGLAPHEHEATSRGFELGRGRPLQRDLGQAGYDTFHVSPTTWIGDWLPQGRGFDRVREFTGPAHRRFDEGADVRDLAEGVERGLPWYATVARRALAHEDPVRSLANAAAYVWDEATGDAWLDDRDASRHAAEVTREELARARGKASPFFGFVHLMDPHLPFYVPEETRSRGVTPPGCSSWEEEVAWMQELMDDIWAIRNGERVLDEAELAYLRTRYRDELATADRALGHILDALAELGLREDTLVAVTSDHGEHLGEALAGRTMLDHQASVRWPVMHVPLVVRWPGVFEDERRSTLVQPHELASTIRHLAGLDPRGSPTLAPPEEEPRVAMASYRGVVPSHPPEDQASPFLERSRATAVTGSWKVDAVADGDGLPAVSGPEDLARAARIDWDRGSTREVPIEAVPDGVTARLVDELQAAHEAARAEPSSATIEAKPGVERRLRQLGYLG